MPCTRMLKKHFGENLIPHVQLRAIFLTPLQQAFCKPPLKTFPRVKEMKFIYAKNVQKSIIQWKQWTHGTTVYLQSKLSQGWSDHQAMSAPAVDTEHVLSYLPLWLFQVPLEIKQKQIQNKSQKDGNTTLSIRNIKEPFLKIKGCLRTSQERK